MKFKTRCILILTAIVVVLLIFWPYNIFERWHIWSLHYNVMKYNELGDFIGGITSPILSAVTIWLVYKTYKSQKRELERTQLALQSQQASTSFFSMLSTLVGIYRMMDYDVTHQGHAILGSTGSSTVRKNSVKEVKNEIDKLFDSSSITRTKFYQAHSDGSGLFDLYGRGANGWNVVDSDIVLESVEYAIGQEVSYNKKFENESMVYFIQFVELIIDFIYREFPEIDQPFYFRLFRNHIPMEGKVVIFYRAMNEIGLIHKIHVADLLREVGVAGFKDKEHWLVYTVRHERLAESVKYLKSVS